MARGDAMKARYGGLSGDFAHQLQQFAEQAQGAIDASLREIVIEIGSSVIQMSPVGNPELWAANVNYRSKASASADAYDSHVEVRNVVKSLTPSNFTKSGNLKKSVKYAKPLTKTERIQNFDVNGLVTGKGYVGGRFRGNWQFTIGVPAVGELDRIDPTGAATLAALRAEVATLTAGQTAYIVNNLPYAIPLEYGHSTQSPQGMVRVTLARFQQIVNEAVRNNQI
jgi:hypothetical protein